MADNNAYRVKTDPDPYEAFKIAQAYRSGNHVYVSGQAAINQGGNIVGVGEFDAQDEQVFANLKSVLEAGGSAMERIIKVNIYVTEIAEREEAWRARAEFFTGDFPCSTLVCVSQLFKPDALVEIEAIGVIGAGYD